MPPIALVTGANRGIGHEVTRRLAREGYHVYLAARELHKAEEAAVELAAPDRISPAQLDVTDQASVEALASRVSAERGVLDALVNNAGINYDTWQNVLGADLNNVRDTLETNLLGPWRVCMAFGPLLRKSAHPRVVNVSSGSGCLSEMGAETPAYGVSKAGLNALTCKLAAEMRSDAVLVNAVCPGWVATDMGGPGGGPIGPGADSVVWGVLLPDDGPTGGFFRYGRRLEW